MGGGGEEGRAACITHRLRGKGVRVGKEGKGWEVSVHSCVWDRTRTYAQAGGSLCQRRCSRLPLLPGRQCRRISRQ
jgi:hypothetical protein